MISMSMTKARQYIMNIELVETNKLKLILEILEELKDNNALTSVQEWLMPRIAMEVQRRKTIQL